MVKIINIAILLLMLLLPFILLYTIYSLIKGKPKIHRIFAIFILLGMIALITIFYVPSSMELHEQKQLTVTLHRNGQIYKIVDLEQVKEIKELVEKQKFIRSVSRTLVGSSPVPSDQYINVFFEGKDIPFSQLISVRMDTAQSSYLERDSQYYKIVNAEAFVQNMVDYTSRIMP